MYIIDKIFEILATIDSMFWEYAFIVICSAGLYLTIISKGFQFKVLFNFKQNLLDIYSESKKKDQKGLNPFKLFFTSVGGMVGLGNIIMVGVAVMVGGPGSIFWMWVASFCGMLIKYSEIYLGVKHRVSNGKGSYNGGPMYYLQIVFKRKAWAYLSAVLLCIYGVEVLQFLILVNRIEYSFSFQRSYIVIGLIILVFYSATGGMKRLSTICSIIMPVFMVFYVLACSYIIILNLSALHEVLITIITSAFNGTAALGGFIGSTAIQAAYLGTSKAVYSGDIGIGYDSVVQSETRVLHPHKQARLSIYALFIDTFICTMTTITICITGAWHKFQHIDHEEVMSVVLGEYFIYSDIFLTIVLFFAGFTTIIAYFVAGVKSAEFIFPKYGKVIYLTYGILAFIICSNFTIEKVATIMGLSGVLLVLLNITAIMKMRNEIRF